MKILLINTVCGIRSTGRIVTDLAEKYMADGHECRIAYGREEAPEAYRDISYRICSGPRVKINALKSRLFDNEGFNAKRETARFIRWAEQYDPDVLWLHNLHGNYLNISMLFDWIKKKTEMEVKWTLHDCWPFTGHCAHFSAVQCYKWKTACEKCPQKKQYPPRWLGDRSRKNYTQKRQIFTGVERMTLITPSQWLASLVQQSFLGEYPIEVVHNTVNTDIFKPTESDFRKRYGLEKKKIVLGVASSWTANKGLEDFVELSQKLGHTYQVVLVGVSSKQKKTLPSNILALGLTNSPYELVAIYSAADVFVNPSREETFGLTTLEAISCGTPAIVYRDTACEEVVNTFGGTAVAFGRTDELIDKILEFSKSTQNTF